MEYGCIGEKLGHSFSKEIHNALADYDYQLKELTKDELPLFMEEHNFKAINVTIPYKQDVIPYLYWISDEAKAINAVNTVVNVNGKLYGYNTDFYGLKALIKKENVSLKGKKVVVLGSGGTSNTAFAVANSMGAESVLKVSRSPRENYITYEELYEKYTDCEIIINTTPCGMFPKINVSAVDINKFTNLEAVFDAVYNPLSSKFVLDAKEKGVIAAGGLYMLVMQAAYAVEKFINKPVDFKKADDIFKTLYKDKMNIVLIGMPASGKSTVGKALSNALGKSFADADEKITEAEEKSIPEIFAEHGEKYFREVESNVIHSLSMKNSLVIATGGGVILNKTNIDVLKGNGRVYFIDRPLDMLITTNDRPLSSNRADLEKRYNERYRLYKSYADVVIEGSGSVEEVSKRIEVDFSEYSCN
ncbi:MAG: shikimate dehydrogenase [Oscillospiraceae bacterium]|nr:shikimate dehydrogenase [Oscillospiraceae bacterium]